MVIVDCLGIVKARVHPQSCKARFIPYSVNNFNQMISNKIYPSFTDCEEGGKLAERMTTLGEKGDLGQVTRASQR